jgi:hypothetical protein
MFLKFLLELPFLVLEGKMMGFFTVRSAVPFPVRKHKPSFITCCDHGRKVSVFSLIFYVNICFFPLIFWRLL